MSAAARAKQIAVLADQVAPLGNKARGMRLTADDWNAIVGVIATLLQFDADQDAETGERLDQAYARADHNHQGQVTLDWLDPELQAQIAGGGERSIPTRQALAAMQQTVESLRSEVARLTALVELQQGTVDRAAADSIDWTRRLGAFDKRFTGIEDLKVTVGSVASAQAALNENIKSVLDLRGQLTAADGSAIDLAKLASRLDDVETLRDSMTGVDGRPLRLKDLQLQVIQLADRRPERGDGGPELDTRFEALSTDLEKRLAKSGATRIGKLRGELTAASSALTDQVHAQLNDSIEANRIVAETAASTLLATAEARIDASVSGQIETIKTVLGDSVRQQTELALAGGLTGLNARVETLIDDRTKTLKSAIAGDLAALVDTRVTQGVAAIDATMSTRLGAVETRLKAIDSTVPGRIATGVADAATALETRLDGTVKERMTTLEQALTTTVDQRLTAGLDAGMVELRGVASRSVADGLAGVDARIAASVTSATRALPDQVAARVDARLTEVNIPGQIAAANAALTTQFRSEIATSAARVQTTNTEALKSAVTGLRGEMSTTRVTPILNPAVVQPRRPG